MPLARYVRESMLTYPVWSMTRRRWWPGWTSSPWPEHNAPLWPNHHRHPLLCPYMSPSMWGLPLTWVSVWFWRFSFPPRCQRHSLAWSSLLTWCTSSSSSSSDKRSGWQAAHWHWHLTTFPPSLLHTCKTCKTCILAPAQLCIYGTAARK